LLLDTGEGGAGNVSVGPSDMNLKAFVVDSGARVEDGRFRVMKKPDLRF
jgi:hypothetical protein